MSRILKNQNPLWMAARTPLLDVTPIVRKHISKKKKPTEKDTFEKRDEIKLVIIPRKLAFLCAVKMRMKLSFQRKRHFLVYLENRHVAGQLHAVGPDFEVNTGKRGGKRYYAQNKLF